MKTLERPSQLRLTTAQTEDSNLDGFVCAVPDKRLSVAITAYRVRQEKIYRIENRTVMLSHFFCRKMMSYDTQFEKWNKWLDAIYNDVQGLLVDRYIYQEVQKIIRANPKIQVESSFYEWMRNVYATSAVIGVRRQLDKDKKSISFMRLLEEIRNKPEIISRKRYISLYSNSVLPKDFAHHDFDRLFGKDRAYINPKMVGKDMDLLNMKTEKIKKFANKRIAHFDKSDFKNLPTYAELNECLDYLEKLLKKYLSIFRAEAHIKIVPVWQYDWKQIFKYPWIEKTGQ